VLQSVEALSDLRYQYNESMHRGSYEDLRIWQKSLKLCIEVYTYTKQFPQEERYGLASQMNRAAVSIPSNIAEGSQRTTKNDFAHFIAISKGSLAELRTQIMIAKELRYLNLDSAKSLLFATEEMSKMLYSFYNSLKSEN
jgi:four helix bundle protein